ncbi:zinc finger protein 62 homolog isoform X2 [Portunus trituberculatus]|uniref:zinc finger protein 62 homolog isoform X2 n=1 Tax=Portunus trituberculatus TaxID=210409 RepID=UPI001E1D1B62|nr:zinc finger protein 62 homolog isoform X2 [Portunus trituberculatus]
MVAGTDGAGSGLCVVCAKVVSSSLVSVHASLVTQNGSIHRQMGQVVGMDQLEEACQATEFVCSICLRLLLSIVNLESKVVMLKNEFQATFLQGAELRRKAVIGGKVHLGHSSLIDKKQYDGNPPPASQGTQDNLWNRTHLDHCEKPERAERFFCHIPLDSECNAETPSTSEPPADDRAQDAKSSVKDETAPSESSAVSSRQSSGELETQLALDTSAAELSDLLPSHCYLGDIATSSGSQGREEPLREVDKRPNGNPSMQHYPLSPSSSVSTLDAAKPVQCGSEGNKTYVTSNLVKQDSECLPDSEGSSEQTLQRRLRKSRKEGQETWQPGASIPKRARALKTTFETKEPEADTEGWTSKESGAAQFQKRCELCGDQFSNAKQLGRHRREAHSAVYCHVCEWCPNICYREKSKLTQHLRRLHNITAHKCPGCMHQAVSQNALDQHIITQHPESRFFECHICHKAFRTHRYLHFVHIKRCHLGLPIKYSCEKCNKGFVDKSSLENHKITHAGARNFTCEFCGARFLTPYALKVHINTHTREKKYECEDCGLAFLRMCNLCAHKKRFHSTNDVKLVCEICGKSMATRKDLRRHQVAQHSKEKPFRCPQCPRCYAAKESLKNHLRTHTGEKPYVCACGKAFYKSNVLRRHQRCVHEGEDLQQEAVAAEMDSVQVGGNGELEREEHMVVITLKECNPPAVYTVQSSTAHLQEIMVSSEGQTQGPADASLLAEGAEGLPLLHSSLGALGRGRLALSTPVLLTSLTDGSITVPDATFATQVTTVDASLPSHPPATFQPTSDSPAPTNPIVSTKSPQVTQDPLADLGPASCSDLLHLPSLHAAAATPVSLVAPWPSSAL